MDNLLVLGILILFFVFCFGAIIGSFLNVVILRAFSGESIVLPPSKCPKCGNRLKWWHNIPILSYVLLRGKCYFCHEKISIQYPIIEFITGVIFLIVFIKFGISFDVIFAFAVAGLLIVISVTDIKEKVVFDMHTYSLVAVGLVYNFCLTAKDVWAQINTFTGFHPNGEWVLNTPIVVSLLGVILGIVVMEIAARIGYLIAGARAFGEGDTYIAAGLGAVFGWLNVALIIGLAIVIQLVLTLPLFLIKLAKNKNWTTLLVMIGFFLYTIAFYVVEHKTALFDSFILMILGMILLFILGISACFCVIRGLKDRDNLTYLPFGPALAIAGMLLLVTNVNFFLGQG